MEAVGSILLVVAHCQRKPELLIIYLSENDLPHTSAVELTDVITVGLKCISRIFLGSAMAWVDLLPRRVCYSAIKPKAVDVNQTMHKVMQWNQGSVIGRPSICFGLPHLFRDKIVHLSPARCDIYLANLASRIKVVFPIEVGKEPS